ncbi:hypothetical protein GCM10010082_18550 [Kushneria pakistanensis]|uniref:Uncharacterized protein n=1 Tax=Kushneria pakistanensis TaxID=1508770 RepID=A0ABQ3FIS4_9GAMM|nr:hypothetical protein GCM10010082_18550 [Kushneria pakistanensis]
MGEIKRFIGRTGNQATALKGHVAATAQIGITLPAVHGILDRAHMAGSDGNASAATVKTADIELCGPHETPL